MADWRTTLADAGVTVDVVDADHVRLVDHADDLRAGSVLVQIKAFRYPITPSKVPPAPEGGAGLLIVPSATRALIQTARARGWSVITDDGTADVVIGERRVQRAPDEGDSPARQSGLSGRGPISWPRWTIIRVLLATGTLPLPQSDAAQLLGTSQATVSRAISTLERDGLVRTTESANHKRVVEPTDWDRLLDWWLQHYPGPGGTDSYWYSLDELRSQARHAVAELGRASSTADPVLSGDLAADYVAPWRRPASIVLYVRHSAPLDHAGFVSVAGPQEATLVVRAPKDPGVWMPTEWPLEEETELRLADPVQVLHDLMHAAGPDSGEAVAHLRVKLRTDLRKIWAMARLGQSISNPAARNDTGAGL